MADDFYTSADLVKINDANVKDLGTSDIVSGAPAINVMPAVEASNGEYHKYLKETAGAVADTRAINEGVDLSASDDTEVSVQLDILTSPIQLDVRFVKGKNEEKILARTAERHMQAVFKKAEDLFFAKLAASAELKVNAGGTTADSQTSAYLVRASETANSLVWGNDAQIEMLDWQVQQVKDASGKTFHAYVTDISGLFGVQMGSKFDVVRIANINEADGNKLSDDLISNGLERMEHGDPSFIFGSRAAVYSLQRSRSATRADGADAPRVTDYEGIPVITSPGIGKAEALVSFS